MAKKKQIVSLAPTFVNETVWLIPQINERYR